MSTSAQYVLWASDRTEPLLSQLPHAVVEHIVASLQQSNSQVLVVDGRKTRVIRKASGEYTALAASSDPNRVASKRLIESDINAILAAASTIDTTLRNAEARTRRLLHNLKSLTAKTSQEIFDIARQDRLVGSPREAVPYLASEIKNDVEGTARALLEILKHQAAQKAEYTAFDRLSGKLDPRNVERHSIHRVLMNVFYLFFGEFVGKKVHAEVEKTLLQAIFDYDSVHVCIYYLVENAAKYVRPNSELRVTVVDDGSGFVDIRFSMESLIIQPQEVERIFEEGYSGVAAKEAGLSGGGIGLYLARAMARLNGGRLTVIPGRPIAGSKYARNAFILGLPAR